MMDTDAVFSKLLADHQSQVIDWAWEEYSLLMDACESPIEEMLAPHLLMIKPILCGRRWGSTMDHPVEIQLVPQFVIENYRVDFAMFVRPAFDQRPTLQIAIECDGHEFHDATKEAAERDKRRGNDLQVAGWNVLRFTGAEINRSPSACAEKVVNLINAHVIRGMPGEIAGVLSVRQSHEGGGP